MPAATLRAPFATPPARLLTLHEAAQYLQIAAATLKHWAHQKRIEYVKVGKYMRFTQAALDRYIASQTVTPTGEL